MTVRSRKMMGIAASCAVAVVSLAGVPNVVVAQTPKPTAAPTSVPAVAQVPAPALLGPGTNLLTNPGHEHPGAYFGGRGEINVTWNWTPFWEESPPGKDPRDQYYRTPEFRPPFARDYPGRVHSGGGSDRWFNFYALNKKAGIMQYVANLPVGAPVRFTTWLETWSSNDNLPLPSKVGHNEGNLKVKVCIDQDGGPRNMDDPNLKCSDWATPNDKWVQLSVDAVAQNSVVNAIIWSTAEIPVQHNDIYADDSCLEVLSSPTDKGICAGAGFIPTGPNVPPVPANAPDIKITAEEQAKALKASQPQTKTQVKVNTQAGVAISTVKVPTDTKPALAVNAKVSLNARATPSNTGKIIGSLKRGAVLPVLGKSADGKWFEVSVNGASAWVLGSLTLPNAAAKAAAVVS